MLVLSRRSGETIELGSEISVEVICVQGNRVRIGIRAPKHVRIIRGELAFRELNDESALCPIAAHPEPEAGALLWTAEVEPLAKV